MVCRKCWEPRQPQDFLRGKKDNQAIDWSRTEGDDVESDVTFTTGVTLNWNHIAAFSAAEFRGVYHQDGLWVIVGSGGSIYTSDDSGITWTSRVSGVAAGLREVKYWNGNWWIVGTRVGAGRATVLKSADGITWSSLNVASTGTHLVDIAFNDTTMAFVGLGAGSIGYLLTTVDGITFSEPTGLSSANTLRNIEWNSVDSLWGVAGGSVSEYFGTSSDLITWAKKTTGGTDDLFGLNYDGTNWMLANGSAEIFTSPDSTTWTQQDDSPVINGGVRAISSNSDGVILLCGYKVGFASGDAIVSRDLGVSWEISYLAEGVFGGIVNNAYFADGIWIIVGWDGVIAVGIDTLPVETQIPSGSFDNSLQVMP